MAGIGSVVVAGLAVASVIKLRKRVKASRMRKRAGNLTEASEILSCLVAQVYAVDRAGRRTREYASKIWQILGYEVDERYGYKDGDDHGGRVRLVVFCKRDDGPTVTPRCVVAIRGTKLSLENMKDDFRIAAECLHGSDRYDAISNVIKKVVKEHREENVCVAGHSLGAAFALLATRELALEGKFVDTHLFNPPFLSTDVLLEKGWDTVRMLVARMSKTFEDLLTAGSRAANARFNEAMESEGDKMHLEAKAAEFSKLQSWTPHLYVNPGDVFCNGYTKHFQGPPRLHDHPDTMLRSTSAQARLLRKMCIESNSFQLIPSAILAINYREKWPHKLSQWFKYQTVNLTRNQCSLLIPEPNSNDQSSAAAGTDEVTIIPNERVWR